MYQEASEENKINKEKEKRKKNRSKKGSDKDKDTQKQNIQQRPHAFIVNANRKLKEQSN